MLRHIRRSFLIPSQGAGLVGVVHLTDDGWCIDVEDRSGLVMLSQPIPGPPEKAPKKGVRDNTAEMWIARGMVASILSNNPRMIPAHTRTRRLGAL